MKNTPMLAKNKKVNARASLQRIFPVFKKHRQRLLFGFIALLGVDFLQLQIPRILKHGIDSLSQHTATGASLLQLAGLILLIACVVGVLRFAWRILIIGFSRILERDLRVQVFTHLLQMDRPFFGRWSTGTLMAHSGNDLSAIQLACGMGMVAGVDALVMGVAAVGFMMVINMKLTLIALLPMPVLAVSTKILSAKMHTRFTLVQKQFGHMTEFVRNGLVSIRLLKGYCLEDIQRQEFSRLGKEYVQSNLKVAIIQGGLHPLAMLTGNAGMLLVLYFGGGQVIDGIITLGDFVAFVTYLTMLIWPMMAIGWVANLVQRGLSSLQRITILLEEQAEVTGGIMPVSVQDDVPCIECRQLKFTYPEAENQALNGIDLTLHTGIIGISGRTGSGKSTLCRVLARLYPVDKNMLFWGDREVHALATDSIRDQISYVSQEVFLFSDTMYNNICFGRPDASRSQVEAAARAAGIAEDILGFSEGYDSLVGERGVKLSGGQRQRIALARALLCDRPVLIIDDGLSALDVKTEQQVFAGIKKQYTDRLVLLVSHRINLLRKTDQIIMLDEGIILASGDHEQVYAASSLYRIMADKQRSPVDA